MRRRISIRGVKLHNKILGTDPVRPRYVTKYGTDPVTEPTPLGYSQKLVSVELFEQRVER